jgi:hypothetical protein
MPWDSFEYASATPAWDSDPPLAAASPGGSPRTSPPNDRELFSTAADRFDGRSLRRIPTLSGSAISQLSSGRDVRPPRSLGSLSTRSGPRPLQIARRKADEDGSLEAIADRGRIPPARRMGSDRTYVRPDASSS